MSEFIRDKAGATEAQQKKALAYLLKQVSAGLASTGVLTGLAVTQTGTASVSVLIAAGAGASQDTVGNGASMLVNDTQKTLDVLTANPMGGTPRNDMIVFDSATGLIGAIIGTPNAVPTDPTVPTTAIPLARIRNLASATTIPTAQIDDLRVFTRLAGTRQPAVVQSRTTNVTGIVGSTVDVLSGVTVQSDGASTYKVSAVLKAVSGTLDDQVEFYLQEGATVLQTFRAVIDAAGGSESIAFFVTVTPSAGSHTYKLTANRTSGAGTSNTVASSTAPTVLMVEHVA